MKLENLNMLRSIAIIFIIIGHCCLQFGNEPVGRFCGYLFVQIFFLMSALLLGMKYGRIPTTKSFLFKRWKKISIEYYVFLVISIAILYAINEPLSITSILAHFAYINFFIQSKLCKGVSFGHLWYISMIMGCYLMITVLCSPFFFYRIHRILNSWNGLFVAFLVTFVAAIVFRAFSIPSRIAVVLVSYLVVFVKANELFEYMNDCKKNGNIVISILFFLSNLILFSLFLCFNLNEKLILRDFLVLAVSFIWLFFFMIVLRNVKCGKILPYISNISFELYLVHHPLIMGKFSWLNSSILTKNIYVNTILVFGVVVLLSIVLNYFSKLISRIWIK